MSYRDDRTGLELRVRILEDELSGIQSQKHELAALVEREKHVQRELADTRGLLERTPPAPGTKRRLLENVAIASPCNESWDDMVGTREVRFCGRCQKNVYDVSAMTRENAEEVLRANDGLCVRIYKRADGTVMTSDCPVGVERERRRRRLVTVVGLAIIGGGVLLALSQVGEPVRSRAMGAAVGF